MKRAIAICIALGLTGCGDEAPVEEPPAPSSATELTVTLDPDGADGRQRAETRRVVCESGAGDSPCSAVTARDFAPADPNLACTEIYGGPDELTVEGTVGGEAVASAFTRADGCQIERFERFLPLLDELFPGYRPGASLR